MKYKLIILLFLLGIIIIQSATAQVNIPVLNWTQLSDWINVKNAPYNAYGDGIHDDTAALQSALNNLWTNSATIYIPSGTFLISSTLQIPGPNSALSAGSAIIGNGRNTTILWGGASGGVMLNSLGCGYSRYIGITWEGAKIASVGFNHQATNYETHITHQNESFRDFIGYGILIGSNQVDATSEVLYRNCLFTNCEIGAIGLLSYNDYDNIIDHCEFKNNGSGIYALVGNFYARECHFSGTTNTDIYLQSTAHGSSVRRCTSVNSKYFVYNNDSPSTLTIQDCQVSNWTSTTCCLNLQGFNGTPAMVFDCVFTNGNSIPIITRNNTQPLILCNNNPVNISNLVAIYPVQYGDSLSSIYVIPNGQLSGTITNANQTFLQTNATVPTKIFDAKVNFGAVGNNIIDDTTAIKNTINAASAWGNGALAYFPLGNYKISQTLIISGTNFIVGGSGVNSILTWAGSAGLNFIVVSNVQNVTVNNFNIGNNVVNVTYGDDMWITSTNNVPINLTIDNMFGWGKYQDSNLHGSHFDSLPLGSTIMIQGLYGNIWITNCSQASLLFRSTEAGELTIRGPASTNNIVGFLYRVSTDNNLSINVMENQSLIISDYYDESSAQIASFSGNSPLPPTYLIFASSLFFSQQNLGAITIQEVKMGNTNNPIFTTSNYNGRICFGPSSFESPSTQMFQTTNSSLSLQLIFDACFWNSTTPEFEVDTNTILTLIQNNSDPISVTNSSIVTSAASIALSASMDDLRRVGQLDYTLSISDP